MPDAAVEEQGTCQRSMPTMRSKLSIFKGSGNPPAWSPICATAQRTGHPPCRIGRHIPRKVHSSARFLEPRPAVAGRICVLCAAVSARMPRATVACWLDERMKREYQEG